MDIRTLLVGQMQSNCYLVTDNKTSEAIIIDAGDDAQYISRIIGDLRVKPIKIIATHGHFDHIMAVTELQLAYNIPFLINKKDEFLVKRIRDSAKFFLDIESGPPPKINGFLKESESLKVGSLTFKIIESPGHTPGSVSLYSKKKSIIFVGDLIFSGGSVGRTDFSYSHPQKLMSSIKKILKLPERTKIYPGHGSETRISRESKFHST
jgi:glyoxylase-like metal-dependent hydrolase (beta-lactamase superfamily II)